MTRARRHRSRPLPSGAGRKPLHGRTLWLLVAAAVLAATAVVATLWFTGHDTPAAVAWARLGTADVHSLLFDPADPDRLLFGHHGGLLEADDGGRTWRESTLTGADAMNVRRLDGARLQIAGHEVFLESADAGVMWAPVPNDLPGLDLHAFTVDPAEPDRAWVFAVGHGLYTTTDAGRHWRLLDAGNWGALASYVRDDTTMLVAVGPSGLVRSRDAGESWEPMTYPGAPLATLAAAEDGSALYAATSAGLRRSTDEGSTWSDTGFAGQALAVAVSPSNPDQVAVVDPDTRFYRSSDAGATWPGP
ncbi:MAG: YCF48-related protein [Candidatus Limnocylindria bacterium]